MTTVLKPDLVLVRTLDPEVDHNWIAVQTIALDATYSLGAGAIP